MFLKNIIIISFERLKKVFLEPRRSLRQALSTNRNQRAVTMGNAARRERDGMQLRSGQLKRPQRRLYKR